MHSYFMKTWKFINRYNQLLFIILVPLIFSPLPILINSKSAKCAYTIILMASFWITKAIPIGLTSLIPVLLFPVFGILPAEKVTLSYFKDIVMLFLGGLIVASAIEMTKLHERLALKVLIKFGSNPKWLMLGFMLITSFISLWITNTAATVMMLPIIDAVVQQLIKVDKDFHEPILDKSRIKNANKIYMSESTPTIVVELNDIVEYDDVAIKNTEQGRKLLVGFLMACAFSATIGGMGSLVGSSANILIKGYFDRTYSNIKLDFLSYMLFALPIAIIMILFSWVWLMFQWLPRKYTFNCKNKPNVDNPKAVNDVIKQKFEKLGNATWGQKCVGVLFVLLVILWITRDMHSIGGWGVLFKKNFITDSTPVIFIVFLLFICPRDNIFEGKPYKHLIEWDQMQKQIPWDIIFLIGGGLVIADGFQESGLSKLIGAQLELIASKDDKITLLLIMVLSALATEFTSNMSMASVLLPIVDVLAESLKVNPIYFLLPMILSVSLAFMLPIANPNNAIIFATRQIKILDMITSGVVLNIIGLITIYVASNTWLGLVFDIKYISNSKNTTFINNTTLIS